MSKALDIVLNCRSDEPELVYKARAELEALREKAEAFDWLEDWRKSEHISNGKPIEIAIIDAASWDVIIVIDFDAGETLLEAIKRIKKEEK